jgi:hypothetical protein
MAKRLSRGKKEETDEEDDNLEEEKPAKKAKAKKAAPKKKTVVAKPGTNARPMSVGGIINKGTNTPPDWDKDAPWHRKSNATSRFADHGTDRRPKD